MAKPDGGIAVIAGLGNPGPQYEGTRHNAGFWLVEAIADAKRLNWRHERKFHGEVARLRRSSGEDTWLIKPLTFMNRSGQAVAALSRFYKVPPERVLVVHDELDLPPGTVRLKYSGGHGGHNGLRSLHDQLGSRDYWRLRIGIGHPGHKDQVLSFVLGRLSPDDRQAIFDGIDATLDVLDWLLAGDLERVAQRLHTKKTGDTPAV